MHERNEYSLSTRREMPSTLQGCVLRGFRPRWQLMVQTSCCTRKPDLPCFKCHVHRVSTETEVMRGMSHSQVCSTWSERFDPFAYLYGQSWLHFGSVLCGSAISVHDLPGCYVLAVNRLTWMSQNRNESQKYTKSAQSEPTCEVAYLRSIS